MVPRGAEFPERWHLGVPSQSIRRGRATEKRSIVELAKPPITTLARGLWTSASADVARAIGMNPNALSLSIC
jgi:hypothetical protein